MNSFDLEDRLILFSIKIITLSNDLRGSIAGRNLANQLVRSGISVSLNYGEAQSAESRKDFVHKMKIVLKELRETMVCLKIIEASKLCRSIQPFNEIRKENDELISIFVTSIKTAIQNMQAN